MKNASEWNERYVAKDLPWDTGRTDQALKDVIAAYGIQPCRAFEFGCGTGTNSIWLAQEGFDVVATDLSEVALDLARNKADGLSLDISWIAGSILEPDIAEGPFGFAFDRGCFHSFDSVADRRKCVKTLAGLLDADGLWLSLIGSSDGPPREFGPPRRSVSDISAAVEKDFEILSLEAIHFDSDMDPAPSAWRCLMRKRG